MAKWNRRQFLSGLLAAAGADATLNTPEAEAEAVLPFASGSSDSTVVSPSTPDARPAVSAAAPGHPVAEGEAHALQQALPEGTRFGRWRIAGVLPVKLGAVPVILETRHGVRFQVDILRRDRRPGAKRGIAETRQYALYLANLGRGMKPTREEHGLGLIWLAALLRSCESRHATPALLTLRERLLQHPGGRFSAVT
jgi:hypothetical protein